MNDLQVKLTNALEQANANIENYFWKTKKTLDANGKYIQNEVRLLDVSEEELKKFYNHCKTMLFNNDPKNPGRKVLLKTILEQRDKCGVELFYRDAAEKGSSRFVIVDSLRTAVKNAELNQDQINDLKLGDLLETHSDYVTLPYKLIVDGGTNSLGRFDRSHITLTFIVRQGIWFSEEEKKEYGEVSKYAKDKIAQIKSNLKLPDLYNLSFNPETGLSVKQMKSMLSLKIKKYSEMSLDQLETLRYKLLFKLEDQVHLHIDQWTERMEQIEKVAKAREINL